MKNKNYNIKQIIYKVLIQTYNKKSIANNNYIAKKLNNVKVKIMN